ncbi:hypothetical protein LDO26_11495 [Luteimonas sp. BDR2-5]|uniref:DUF6630 family protein n=1 Tax=Proluteimonas luteida TaxID=2878685 RepID=UPI001E46A78C|nr:hypothetical protein [Luteimonas sp. BDR2-5]MCD9028830.1 hypothetical protein [Luteimonas sp. BDR2-5]
MPMTLPDTEFDPDDNFAAGDADGIDLDDDAAVEVLVWQLLLLINPGDEESAAQQFRDWQEATAGADDDRLVPALQATIDWKSGFHVAEEDPGTLIDAINELAARYNLDLDWGVEDPTDAEFLDGASPHALLELAYDQLRVDGYTLWTRETGGDTLAGWFAARDDDEAVRLVAHALGIEVRPGAG